MVFYRLRTRVCAKEVARAFGISELSLSRIFCTWANFLDKELSALMRLPSLSEVQRYMPESFRDFPNTRAILDCTEVRIQKTARLNAQRQTFSTYKHYNTLRPLWASLPMDTWHLSLTCGAVMSVILRWLTDVASWIYYSQVTVSRSIRAFVGHHSSNKYWYLHATDQKRRTTPCKQCCD